MKKMTLQDLLRKNALCEMRRRLAKQEPAKVEVVEETPHKIILDEDKLENTDGEKEKFLNISDVELAEEPKPAPKKKGGRKPANREYMVVEDIDEVNK